MSDYDIVEEVLVHYNTEEIVCPHCGFFYYDCTDFEKDEDKENCVKCGERFFYRRNVFVTYDTWKGE